MAMFNATTGAPRAVELVPAGHLCWAFAEFREFRYSNSTGGRYAAMKITIADGSPYAGRVFFTNIMDPDDARNSDAARQMGHGALQRALESAAVFYHGQPDTYTQFGESATMEDLLRALSDRTVAIKVKIQKGKDGYADKNDVGEWLTPNPAGEGAFKAFERLAKGDNGLGKAPVVGSASPTPAAAVPAGFAQPAAAAVQPSQAKVAAPGSGQPAWLAQAQGARPQT